jgi:preprotein translocase subunit SecG
LEPSRFYVKAQSSKYKDQSTKLKFRSFDLFTYILYGLFILSCVVLIVSILLQPGKADAGALFSSSLSSTAFGPRGTASLLAKITIGAAAAFMLIALMLALPALTGSRSVLQSTSAPTSTPTPAQQPAPSGTTAPATAPAASPSASK